MSSFFDREESGMFFVVTISSFILFLLPFYFSIVSEALSPGLKKVIIEDGVIWCTFR